MPAVNDLLNRGNFVLTGSSLFLCDGERCHLPATSDLIAGDGAHAVFGKGGYKPKFNFFGCGSATFSSGGLDKLAQVGARAECERCGLAPLGMLWRPASALRLAHDFGSMPRYRMAMSERPFSGVNVHIINPLVVMRRIKHSSYTSLGGSSSSQHRCFAVP